MTSKNAWRLLGLLSVTSVIAWLPACSSDSSTATPGDIVREGDATASELETFLGAASDDWAWAGGQFDSPADNHAILPKDSPFTFSWHSTSTDSDEAGAASESEMIYLLVFATPSNAELVRVFTTQSEYTPDAHAWQTLVAARESIEVTVTTATFAGEALTVEGGPHVGQTRSFTIE